MIPNFRKERLSSETRFRAEMRKGSHIIEPIRMRLMADEMFQLSFQIENLDQILENPRVYNKSLNQTNRLNNEPLI